MTDIIEQDALANTPDQPPPPTPHTHEVSSFVATPRMDQGVLHKMLTWFKSELKPGMHVVHKDNDPLRYMFIITSNSYMDRDDETITSAALKAYEDSCYPGEDVFHCDNPLLWWHDDDVVMGEIVAVNYSEPFLVEVAREAPTLMAKVLWDYAEANEHNAGASHRFGYLESDKQADGTYTRIFKQESTYLPERGLAANLGTYAGVIKQMASPQSDKRIDEIFEKAAGVKNAAAMIHAKSGELDKELAARGIQHKAAKPPIPPADVPVTDVAAEVVEEDVKADAPPDVNLYMEGLSRVMTILMEMVDAQAGMANTQTAMAKSLKDLEETRTAEKAADKVTLEGLSKQVEILEKRLALQPRSVTHEKGSSAEDIKAAIDGAEKSRLAGELVDVPGWGKLKPAPNYGK